MTAVTRRALRVYSALSGLKATNEDILDALIPFLEPILEVMNDKIFDPALLATGVRRLYRWRFTRDIAEQFIPRLVKKGYLERRGDRKEAVYVVHFSRSLGDNTADESLTEVLEQIIDKFEKFPPRVTDLLNYSRSRDALTDILIRFLVSIDAYREPAFATGLDKLQLAEDSKTMLGRLEEGGTPLPADDRYMCARFVKDLCKTEPQFVPHLSRLASIGLLTEVVEDFVHPVQRETRVDLTIAVDAPLALDLLGCSGTALQEDVKSIFDSLKAIGCKLIVFPITCQEISRNLKSMLALPGPLRHGYTHEAILRGEVLQDYVISVANDPEKALNRVGVQLRQIDRRQYPALHVHFDDERYEDFFSAVNWVTDVAPREHDATCMALVMRLRAGKNSSDIFRCGIVLVTRNSTFVRQSRAYCLQSHLVNEVQEGPVIHQRELATVAWLRTGLGADDKIPRGHLLASCERVLRVRPELTATVGEKLREVTPEKFEQYELLLQDYRSVRKLADETLNDEKVVTSENAVHLLEVMRQATIAEEREEFERRLSHEKARSRKEKDELASRARQAIADRDAAQAAMSQRLESDRRALAGIISQQNRIFKIIERTVVALLLIMGAAGIAQYFTSFFTSWRVWTVILAATGLVGLYHLMTNLLEIPKIGLATILNYFSRKLIERKLMNRNLQHILDLSRVNFVSGQIVKSE